MSNNNYIKYTNYQGLLKLAVLFCILSACSSVTPKLEQNELTIPNPIQYFLLGNGKKKKTQKDSLSIEEKFLLQNGDILLRKGFGSISDFIADFLNEKYPITHCGFVLFDHNSKPQVLHTISNDNVNGIYLEPLDQYVQQSQAHSLVLLRLKEQDKIPLVLKEAKKLLALKIPFDMSFDDQDSTALYCIEMMRNVFLKVYQKDLLPSRTIRQSIDVLSMDNFFNPIYFDIIFNHFESIPTN